jgi:ATP/maltotriose-dependent transcriptional regulator MalT
VTVVSAPAGSGKSVLLRSWIHDAGLKDSAAWVPVEGGDGDPSRFWVRVLDALRRTSAGSALVRELTAAPDLDGWALSERLLKDLAPLRERLWLVVDDVHELGPQTLRQLEHVVMRAPPELRLVLATRQDVRLGLHRLRLRGELTEIRGAGLRFTLPQARELLAATGVELPDTALTTLHEQTEGWAAGLRLAALSLAGHPDPERFVREFSGSERTVAGYLLAEVLDRQSEQTRRMLLRTSVLERVNGELADLLTGDSGGEQILQDLEEANAFVVSLDAARSWFRYHHLFADLLRLELRRTAPREVTGLQEAAAGWFAGHGYPQAIALVWQGLPAEAEPWVQRAERTVSAEAEPAAALGVRYVRGRLELGRGRDIRNMLAGRRPAPPPGRPRPLREPLTKGEMRVLRYLPTHLSVPEIASELYVSTNTVKTHVHNVFVKLGTHRRAEAVERARGLGLLAPSAHQLPAPAERWLRA